MRHFDLSPLYRSTIGFDRLFSLLDQASGTENGASAYPPYNIEKTDEHAYRITLAVAGFSENELTIEVKDNALTVQGEKFQREEKEGAEFLYQGIAARNFKRRFQLADHVKIENASLENGLLHINLLREIPESKKPRTIPIGTKTIEAQVEA